MPVREFFWPFTFFSVFIVYCYTSQMLAKKGRVDQNWSHRKLVLIRESCN
jgi:hypothetical protein